MGFNSPSNFMTTALKTLTGVFAIASILLGSGTANSAATVTTTTVPAAKQDSANAANPSDSAYPGGWNREKSFDEKCRDLNKDFVNASNNCNQECVRNINNCAGNASAPHGSSGSSLFNTIFSGMQMYSQIKGNGNMTVPSNNVGELCELTASEARSAKKDVERDIKDLDKEIDNLQKDRIQADKQYKIDLNQLKDDERRIMSDIRKIESEVRKLKNETMSAQRGKEKELSDAKFNLERRISQMQSEIDNQKQDLNKDVREKARLQVASTIDRITKECKAKVKAEYAKRQKENPIAAVSNGLSNAIALNANRLAEANQDLAICINDQQVLANQEVEDRTEKIANKAARIQKMEEELSRINTEQQTNDQYVRQEIDQIIKAAKDEGTALGKEIASAYEELKQNYDKRNELLTDYQNQIKNFARMENNLNQQKSFKNYELNGFNSRPKGMKGSLSEAQGAILEQQTVYDSALKVTDRNGNESPCAWTKNVPSPKVSASKGSKAGK